MQEEVKFPPSYQISRQLDQEKISFLTKRVDDLIGSNNDLRTSSGQNEKDTHDIVLYFQREMEIKDDVILKLNEELVKTQTQLKFEVEKVRKSFDEELSEIRASSESTISQLTEKLETTESELKSVFAFKQAKDQHEGTIAKLDKSLQQQREQLIDAMEEQERRFLEEKANLFKELDEQKAAFREIALEEARSAMGEEAMKILADNNRMFEELKFHHNEAAENQLEKSQLTQELTLAKRDIKIFTDKEIEYAKQAHMRTREIKALRERVEQLERQLHENLERFKHRARELKSSVSKELQEATLDAAGLRRLIQIKNKELRNMKNLAATILSQRTDTEQFFLEALQEVREMIKKERHLTQAQTRLALNKLKSGAGGGQSNSSFSNTNNNNNNNNNNNATNSDRNVRGSSKSRFPSLNVKGANLHLIEPRSQSNLPTGDDQKISVEDLSWEDKELVLRVLFAKMNGVQGGVNQKMMNANLSSGNNKRTQQPMPEPVFISEGADMPVSSGAAAYQQNFEVGGDEYHYDSRASTGAAAAGVPASTAAPQAPPPSDRGDTRGSVGSVGSSSASSGVGSAGDSGAGSRLRQTSAPFVVDGGGSRDREDRKDSTSMVHSIYAEEDHNDGMSSLGT